ncbi:MAG: MBL fold metallo-hydrolase [Ignavibacteria bacterium]|nr:MBL fold metallo-hydrolase [Ignavibacteria bacterium]
MLEVTILGTGTSTGVPSVACTCTTCLSEDPRDKRLRTSLLVRSETTTIVVDTSADFRQQMLTHSVMNIDAIVYTHHHYDHISGFDDTRPYTFFNDDHPLQCFALQQTFDSIRKTFPYAFGDIEQLGGGVPGASFTIIDDEPFVIGDIEVQPIPLKHGNIRVNGYRFGKIAYCTDTNHVPLDSIAKLEDLDILILDALRYHKHPTHFTIEEACEVASMINAKKTYFTHIAHQVKHEECEKTLPDHCFLAYDGLKLTLT